ncbi:MAG: phosphoribosylaminoimidazolecarboxamide formyltransferase [Oscillospiraceae bacterium]|jgi:phosphoribosylaminoimidazolecarboxamide formyltransferase/IMP cyclohydrolase/phosphoribosylaminoimidazolecarboxamide formyltransferase|nr:phosphoribosylaminoimidazolecarboxamide formyltransferase [Oscillospiraceae bacterium]
MENELELKYGCNPGQKPARVFVRGGELPIEVLNGRPGYINLLDALNSYQLARELREAAGMPAAASFKHVSPAGAAIGLPLTDTERAVYFAPEGELSAQASAYARARGADRVSSFGDWAALSDECDEDTARVLLREVSDGVIAPRYTARALEMLRTKRRGGYAVVQIDKGYEPAPTETRDVYGVTFEQGRNAVKIDGSLLDNVVTANKTIPADARRDLITALVTLKYTQSNSVVYAKNGGAIGVGAGQQSRIHCTRLAGGKADAWRLRSHPKTLALPFLPDISKPARDNAIDMYIGGGEDGDILADGAWQAAFARRPAPLTPTERREWIGAMTGVSLGSDAFFPFGDNIERAARSGTLYIAQPGGSVRDKDVIAACDAHGIAMAFTGVRLFHH